MTAFRWANRNRDWLLPAVAIVLMIVTFVIVLGLVADQQQSNLESCRRGNESRIATVKNLRGDRQNLRADRRFLRAAVPPSVGRRDLVLEKNAAIARKTDAIKRLIDSQRDVAVEPGSPEVDCQKAFS